MGSAEGATASLRSLLRRIVAGASETLARPRRGRLALRRAYVIKLEPQQEAGGAQGGASPSAGDSQPPHVDESDLTINVCLSRRVARDE